MKKLIYTGKILTLTALVVLTGCKKDSKVDFPKNPASGSTYPDFTFGTPTIPNISGADGILTAVHVHDYRIIITSPVEKEYQYGMALFTNTTGNFASLTDADSVWVNGANCDKSANLSYLSSTTTFSLGFGGPVMWKVKGAGTVPAMVNTVASGDPTYQPFTVNGASYWSDQWLPTFAKTLTKPPFEYFPNTLSVPHNFTHLDSLRWVPKVVLPYLYTNADSNRWKAEKKLYDSLQPLYVTYHTDSLKFKTDSLFNTTPYDSIPIKNYATNTDTVILVLNDGAGFSYEKKVPATDPFLYLIPNDFNSTTKTFKVSTFVMQLNLIKYYPVIVGTKKYYFLKMGSYIRYWAG
jgi:hypothetical protein